MTGVLAAAGAGGFIVNLPSPLDAENSAVFPATASATVNFLRNGTITDEDAVVVADWISPKHSTIGDSYEVKYDKNSGSNFTAESSANGVWIALTATRTYTISQTVVGTSSINVTWSIRAAGTSTVLDTAPGTVSATIDP